MKKIILFLVMLAILAVSVNAVVIEDTLEEGHRKEYIVGFKTYEVRIISVDDYENPITATIVVNSRWGNERLIEGDSFEFADKRTLTVLNLYNDPREFNFGGDTVTFRLEYEEPVVESKIIEAESEDKSNYYLGDFPEPFALIGKRKPLAFVAGEKAPSSDVLALIDITSTLQGYADVEDLGISLTDMDFLEESDLIDDYNIIAVGNACENEIVEKFTSYKCNDMYKLGEYAAVEIKENKNNYILIVNAENPETRRNAAVVLRDYYRHKIFTEGSLANKNTIFITGIAEDPDFTLRLPEVIKPEIEEETVDEILEGKSEILEQVQEEPQETQNDLNVKIQRQEKPGFFKRIIKILFGWF